MFVGPTARDNQPRLIGQAHYCFVGRLRSNLSVQFVKRESIIIVAIAVAVAVYVLPLLSTLLSTLPLRSPLRLSLSDKEPSGLIPCRCRCALAVAVTPLPSRCCCHRSSVTVAPLLAIAPFPLLAVAVDPLIAVAIAVAPLLSPLLLLRCRCSIACRS